LYFEELSYERVMDIYELETASGVVVSVGGQLPQNIALKLQTSGKAKVLGTDPEDIDKAEDRHKFSSILDSIGVDQPAWKELTSYEEAKKFAESVGYPVLVRPSYVLSGAAMTVIRGEDELKEKLLAASSVSPDHPVVITQYIDGAQEIDCDGVASNGTVLVHAISEHVENAGVHSGDATLVLPPVNLDKRIQERVKEIADKVAKAWNITGPFNMQIIKEEVEGSRSSSATSVLPVRSPSSARSSVPTSLTSPPRRSLDVKSQSPSTSWPLRETMSPPRCLSSPGPGWLVPTPTWVWRCLLLVRWPASARTSSRHTGHPFNHK
jgi:hypothetical protein